MAGPARQRPAPAAEIFYHRAGSHFQQGVAAGFEEDARRTVVLDPAHRGIFHVWGVAAFRTRQASTAERFLKRAIVIEPFMADYRNSLGALLRDQGRFGESAAARRFALCLNPSYAEACHNLANVLAAQGAKPAALTWYRRAVLIKPSYPGAHKHLGQLAYDLHLLNEAEENLRLAAANDPDDSDIRQLLGDIWSDGGQTGAALRAYRLATVISPDQLAPVVHVGLLLMELGKPDEALASFDRALAISPSSFQAWYNRSTLKKFTRDDPDIAAMEECLAAIGDEEEQAVHRRTMMHFALATALLDAGDAEAGFEHLHQANRLERSSFFYRVEDELDGMREIKRLFSPSFIQSRSGAGFASDVPIFVVGMPRSGTTLIEQILASHPQVFGAGERMTMLTLTHRAMGGDQYPSKVPELTRHEIYELGRSYVEEMRQVGPHHRHIVDKMPSNNLLAALIHLCLPNARIIYCRRDAADTCLSCYTKRFGGEQRFAYDMGELGAYYRAADALADHWAKVLPPDRFTIVNYEEVVDDLEAQARRLTGFCGLEWHPACLRFHETEKQVRTASVNQVRKPIYRSSLRRWERYAPYIGPLLDALANDLGGRMGTITIDNVTYEIELLSEPARQQLVHLQFADAEIQRLQMQLAMMQTARTGYMTALKAQLPAR